jgi:ADP-ribose pyrophosphatase YjhB (NUDIX family)
LEGKEMEYPNVPTGITADALIVREGKILLGKRKTDPDKGGWGLIGGFVDPGETLEQALEREIKEETSGCELKESNYLFSIVEKYGKERQILSAIFVCDIDGEPLPSPEMGEFKWVREEFSCLALTPSAARVFHKCITSPI